MSSVVRFFQMIEARLLAFVSRVGAKIGGCSLTGCDVVVMEKVTRVATTAFLSIELICGF